MSDALSLADILKGALTNDLRRPGLVDEAYGVIDDLVSVIGQMVNHSSFCTNRDAVDVLKEFSKKWPRAKILSRNDIPNGFWTAVRRREYLDYLSEPGIRTKLKQERIVVLAKEDAHEVMRDPDDVALFKKLTGLHERGTFFTCGADAVPARGILADLVFGMTLFLDTDSSRPEVCVVPVPPSAGLRVELENLTDILAQHRNYDPALGPMRAFVTCDEVFLKAIEQEYKEIWRMYDRLTAVV
jgi:hypothetical protein